MSDIYENGKAPLTDSEKIAILAAKAMSGAKTTLAVKFRYLDVALNRLKICPYREPYDRLGLEKSMSVNGEYIFYGEKYILRKYKANRNYLNHASLHMVLHRLFKHFMVGKDVNAPLWDLACDIAVEAVILQMDDRSLDIGDREEKQRFVRQIKRDAGMAVAEKIYGFLKTNPYPTAYIELLEQTFSVDNHSRWHPEKPTKGDVDPDEAEQEQSEKDDPDQGMQKDGNSKESEKPEEENEEEEEQIGSGGGHGEKAPEEDEKPSLSEAEMRELWDEISEYVQTDMETMSKQQGDEMGDLMQNLTAVNREKYDYTDFLRKFSVHGEQMQINDDEFDYIFYTYGLSLYKNMPLIEPLEYKEVKKVKEFVVAIDTSGSVSGELVRKFVEKTYNILKSEESFFTKINLHIIQCDSEIHEDVKITNQEDFDRYMDNLTLKGFGGTDFRPVFEYVDKLIKNHEFSDLKGLIYFTDGWGTFPRVQPEYSTAFVFLDDNYNNPSVPVWAIKLVLTSEEI